MMADLTGKIDGSELSGSLDGGETFGVASFSGSLSVGAGASSARASAATVAAWQGSYSTSSGPFAGTGGTWNGQLMLGGPVPFMSPGGLIVLTLLLIGASLFLMQRQAVLPR
jgi:hypothetical protein